MNKGSGRFFFCKEQGKNILLKKKYHKNRLLFKQFLSKILERISFPLELDIKADIMLGLISTRSETN